MCAITRYLDAELILLVREVFWIRLMHKRLPAGFQMRTYAYTSNRFKPHQAASSRVQPRQTDRRPRSGFRGNNGLCAKPHNAWQGAFAIFSIF
jgi:hypothetical protein